MNSSEPLSAGLKALPDKTGSFASTQAAWRFYANESVSLSILQEPLTAAAHEGIEKHCDQYALCVHDWSRLNYKHLNKTDTYAITHETDVGYDLQSSLVVSDQTGLPLAPVAQRLVSADGSYATYGDPASPSLAKHHLEEVSDCIRHLDGQGFPKPLVHLIDREGDSVGHIRRWDAAGSRWLVRAKDNPTVDYAGEPMACKAVAADLAFCKTRQIQYHGKTHWQWVAETVVALSRPAKPSQKKGKQPAVPGIPVAARLVVSRILAEDGKVLAQWLLLTNVADVDAATLALWYYWRWQIECFFKLVKSAGHQLEAWQQESALAIAKRLLVVSQACVTVWEIAADNSPEAAELRIFLIKLSGRQMRHRQAFSNPALLAGLWVFLAMSNIMDSYSQEELDTLKATAQQFLGNVV
ncbi:MAG: hypothetical protein Q8N96_06205 [Methylovulum sp.]|nr:hypothetical protein [Methylovulum sp.]